MKNGGPAFPGVFHNESDRNVEAFGNLIPPHSIAHFNGMTLRDYLAAQAVVGLMAAWSHDSTISWEVLAENAYGLADAMLAAREAPR